MSVTSPSHSLLASWESAFADTEPIRGRGTDAPEAVSASGNGRRRKSGQSVDAESNKFVGGIFFLLLYLIQHLYAALGAVYRAWYELGVTQTFKE